MNVFDQTTVHFMNSFARRSAGFDGTVVFIDHNDLTKGGLIMATLWWSWFKPRDDMDERRQGILAAMLSGFVALAAGHLLGHLLPFRPRPAYEPSLHFVPPYGANPYELKVWSSFPSQHTLFYVALGVGMFAVSPLIATFIVCHTLLFIAGPRVYLGLHYPTDIAGGAVIGALIGWAMNTRAIRDRFAPALLAWHRRHAPLFYAAFFLVTLQLSSMFQGAIDLLKLILLGPKRLG